MTNVMPFRYFFLIGAILPIPFYYCSRKWPQSVKQFLFETIAQSHIAAVVQIRESTGLHERHISHASSDRDKLFVMGNDRVCIPILDTAAPFQGTEILLCYSEWD